MTISLCMIAYNEENSIRRCLESVKELVDEIIIVDAGSTDRTVSICKECGARVYNSIWAEDCSQSRNYCMYKASCDWILLLDADEELEVRDPEGLKQYLSVTEYDLLPVSVTHFNWDESSDEKHAHFSGSLRFVRNDGVVRFVGKTNERMEADDKSIGSGAETRRLVRILHHGYMDDAAENKANKNLSLLLREEYEQPDNPWPVYHLATEYQKLGNLGEAYWKVNLAIIRFVAMGLKPPSLAYKLKYDLLVTTGHYDLAYNGIEKAIMLYSDYVDLHFYKGFLQYKQEEYDKAKSTFLYCLLLGETNMDYLILSGSGSFLALYYIGLCHQRQGEDEQAAEAFRQAKTLCPKIDSVITRFENPKDTGLGQIIPLDEKPTQH